MLKNKVIYQIYPKSFCDSNNDGIGDLEGIIGKLDYLSNLGVDYLWLCPINASPQKDNGYDISNYYELEPMYGTKETFKKLIQEANKRDIKIMMDLVLNHTSTTHEWFQKALAGDPEYQEYYIFRDQPNDTRSVFGGSAWNYAPELKQYYFCYFDKTQADLNWDNPKVREAMYAAVNYWIDFGVEGFRLDVINHISKDLDHGIHCNGPKLATYLEELNASTFKNELLTVGECWGATLDDLQSITGDNRLVQAFHFKDICPNTNEDKFNQGPLDLNRLLTTCQQFENEYTGINTIVLNNHDLPRLASIWLQDTPKLRYYASTLLCGFFSSLKGNLYVYQGDEIGMINYEKDTIEEYDDVWDHNIYQEKIEAGNDPKEVMKTIRKYSRDNARVIMPWDNSSHKGFSKATPWIPYDNASEVTVLNDVTKTHSVYHFYKKMIQFRKDHYELLDLPMNYTIEDKLVVMKKENLTIVANFHDQPTQTKYAASKSIVSNYSTCDSKSLMAYEVRYILENNK